MGDVVDLHQSEDEDALSFVVTVINREDKSHTAFGIFPSSAVANDFIKRYDGTGIPEDIFEVTVSPLNIINMVVKES